MTAFTSAHIVRATLLILFSACCFGSIAPLTIIATRDGAALEQVQALRYGTAGVILLLAGLFGAREATASVGDDARPMTKSPWYSPRVLLIVGLGQSAVAAFSLTALRWIPAATVGFLFYTYPAMVVAITALRGIERLSRNKLLALALSLGGIALMVGAPDAASMHPLGVSLALGAAMVYAVYVPAVSVLQHGRRRVDIARAIAVGGAIVFIGWSTLSGSFDDHLTQRTIAAGIGQGVISALAWTSFVAGLRILGPVRTAITSTAEPFWTALLGATYLAQPIGWGTAIGGAAIVGAVVLLQLSSTPSAPDGLRSRGV